MWWALGVCAGLVVLLGGLVVYFGKAARKTERELGEVKLERDDLEAKLAEQARLFADLLESDPDLGDLAGMSEAAADAAGGPAGGGLSEVESGAINRILRPDADRPAGEGAGR